MHVQSERGSMLTQMISARPGLVFHTWKQRQEKPREVKDLYAKRMEEENIHSLKLSLISPGE